VPVGAVVAMTPAPVPAVSTVIVAAAVPPATAARPMSTAATAGPVSTAATAGPMSTAATAGPMSAAATTAATTTAVLCQRSLRRPQRDRRRSDGKPLRQLTRCRIPFRSHPVLRFRSFDRLRRGGSDAAACALGSTRERFFFPQAVNVRRRQDDDTTRAQPRPTNGIFVAMTVRNCTLASSGRLAM